MSAETDMRALVVDDEPLARELMLELLGAMEGLEVLGSCASGREALREIRRQQPDVVFLDIEMPGTSGFDVVKSIQADAHMPYIVFITAYSGYALRAFDVNAVDYVLKPVARQRLKQAIERVRARRGDLAKGPLLAAISGADGAVASGRNVMEAGDGSEVPAGRLPVRQGDTVHLLAFDDIEWVDAAGDYMCIHARGETHILRCTMKQLSDRLSLGPFARIHRSTLVNVNKVTEISPLSKGECLLHIGDAELKVSRNYRSAIQHLLP